MKKKICWLIAMGLVPSVFAAGADMQQKNEGFHVGATLGYAYMHDMQDSGAEKWTNGAVDSNTTNTKLAFQSGMSFGLNAGYHMDNISYGAEFLSLSSDVTDTVADDATFRTTPTPVNSNTKDVETFSASLYLLNAHYAYPMSGFTPKVGFGLGLANVEFDANNKTYNAADGKDDSSNVFAYQFILGVDKAFGAASVGLEYRYLSMGSNDYIFDSTSSVHQKFSASAGDFLFGLHVQYNV